MKYLIIAGEPSGDLYGSGLIRELLKEDPTATIHCWGGDKMQSAGGVLLKHYRDLSFMGFFELLVNFKKIIINVSDFKKTLKSFNPDILIFIDYPGFNLRVARFGFKKNIRIFYFIPPKVWAWNRSRVHQIKKYIDRVFVILPFEKEFYEQYSVKAEYFGHPLVDEIRNYPFMKDFKVKFSLDSRPIIALLPGSRNQEISRILPIMAEIVSIYPNYQFIIAGAPGFEETYYRKFVSDNSVKIIFNLTYDIVKNSELAIVASGTATLETALLDTPQIVCYAANPLSGWIAKKLIRVRFVSLVNLILNKSAVTELLLENFTVFTLSQEMSHIFTNTSIRQKMLEDYEELRQQMGETGAIGKIARRMVELGNGK